MVIKASLNRLKIAEVPITLHKDGRSRPPHLRSWRDGWRHLRFMLLFSPRWLFLLPGVVLLLGGLFLGLRLLRGPLVIAGVAGLDLNTLLVCAMSVIVGFQLCLFAVFTRIFALTEGLLPASPRYRAVFRIFTLERGVVGGLLLLASGLALLIHATRLWTAEGFGVLSYSESARIVIPAITLLTIGVQTVFSSFFLSILGLKRR